MANKDTITYDANPKQPRFVMVDRQEYARLRAIVQTLAGWHTEASQIDVSPVRYSVTELLKTKHRNILDELCGDAWKALNEGDDGA